MQLKQSDRKAILDGASTPEQVIADQISAADGDHSLHESRSQVVIEADEKLHKAVNSANVFAKIEPTRMQIESQLIEQVVESSGGNEELFNTGRHSGGHAEAQDLDSKEQQFYEQVASPMKNNDDTGVIDEGGVLSELDEQ